MRRKPPLNSEPEDERKPRGFSEPFKSRNPMT